MELYLKVRRAHFQDGLSGRRIARDFGISRDSVAKMLAYSEPPGYRRTAAIKRPKLDSYTDQIEHWLAEDKDRPRKQRHTAKRIFERLRDECGFDGGYTIVKDYVRGQKRDSREMFVPLSHPPGHGQADFGEALVVIGGVEQKAYFFALDLPHSDACYVRAYPAANTEAWLDGHVHAFAFFGAVPQSVLYDNDRCLVAKIMPDGTRNRTQRFSVMLSHYVIRDRYGRPAKGNDKGKVEGLVGYARRNFMVPMPRFTSWSAFNDYLEEQCIKRQADILRGHKISIGERLQADLAAMQDLPTASFEACDLRSGQVTSTSVVRYLRLIERKIMAFEQAAPLQDWDLPDAFATLQRLLEARQGKAGKREYVQVLRLLERFEMAILHGAVRDALQIGAISFDAIKHLLLCRIERRPTRLDLDVYPFLPSTNVATTSARSYMSLLGGSAT
ncbi:MAG: IS21 family transposase [Roseobacter sp.]